MNNDMTARIRAKLIETLQVQHASDGTLPATIEGINEAAARILELFEEAKLPTNRGPVSFSEFLRESGVTIPVTFVTPSVPAEEMEAIMSSDLLVDSPAGTGALAPVVNTDPVETTADTAASDVEIGEEAPEIGLPVDAAADALEFGMATGDINATPEVRPWWEDPELRPQETAVPPGMAVVEATDGNFNEMAMSQLSEEYPFLMFVRQQRLHKGVGNTDGAVLRTVYNDYVKPDALLAKRLLEIAGGK